MAQNSNETATWRHALQGAAVYVLFGMVWIYASDVVLGMFVADAGRLTALQTCKGGGFIVVTAGFVYYLLYRHGAAMRQSCEELEQGKTSLDLLFRALPVGVGTADGRVVTSINERLCEMSGYTEEELVGHGTRILYVSDEEYERVGRAMYAATAEAGSSFMEVRWRRKDGRELDVMLGVAVAHEGAANTDVVFSALDITESREREAMYRLLFEGAYDGLFLMDGQRFVGCNTRAEEMFLAERRQLVGASPLDYSPSRQPGGEDSARAVAKHVAAALEGRPQVFEWQHKRTDGTLLDAEISLNRIGLHSKSYLLAIVRDTTERKRGEAALRKSEGITRALYGISSAAGSAHDIDELYTTIHGILSEHIDATNFYIAMIDEEEDRLTFPIFFDEHDDFIELENISDPEVKSMTLEVIRSGEPLLVGDGALDGVVPHEMFGHKRIVGTDSAIWLGVPLAVGGKIIGAMAVQHYTDPYKYGPEDKAWLTVVSEQVALAIERKRALDALKASEDSLASVFLTVPVGIGVIQNRNLLEVNDKYAEIFGYSREEMTGLPGRGLYRSQEDYEWFGKEIYGQITKRGFSSVEARMARKDGAEIHVLINTAPLSEKDGLPTYTSCVLDITDRKEALEALKASENYLGSIFRAAPAGIAVVQGRTIIAANDLFCEIFGYEQDELVGENARILYASDEEFQRCGKEYYAQLEEAGACSVEAHGMHKDGSDLHLLVNASVLSCDGEDMVATFCVLDITEMKRTLEALQKSEESLSSVFRAVPTGIGIFENRRFLAANERFCEMLGYEEDELVGKNTRMLYVTKDEYERCGELIYSQIREQGRCSVEAHMLRKDGKDIHVLVNGSPLPSEGEGNAITASILDITDRKRAEEALRTNHDKLEEMVLERTGELMESNAELQRLIKESASRSAHATVLNEMGELLQACQTEDETYQVVSGVCAKLFPEDGGCVGILEEDDWSIKIVGMWGDVEDCTMEFAHDDCWAIRRGKAHLVLDPDVDPLCNHVGKVPDCGTLCVPMGARGRVLGMAHMRLNCDLRDLKERERRRVVNEKQILLSGVVERYAPSLVNLRLRETLREQSIRDRLTGLFNRRHMEETLRRELARARRRGVTLGVIMIDVDHFKNFNDTYGHDTGDVVLRELGRFLRGSVRAEDIPCRYGGEELLVILPDGSLEHCRARAEDIRRGIETQVATFHDGRRLQVTASLGVAAFPEHGGDVDTLLAGADAALYKAKEGGRNQVVCHES